MDGTVVQLSVKQSLLSRTNRPQPVVFGSGVRYFGNYDESKLLLEDPDCRFKAIA